MVAASDVVVQRQLPPRVAPTRGVALLQEGQRVQGDGHTHVVTAQQQPGIDFALVLVQL